MATPRAAGSRFQLATSCGCPPVQLVAAWITLFVIGTDLFLVSPLLPLIAAEFRTDAAQTGLLVTAFACGYVFAAPVFGHLADRYGRRRVLICCLCTFSVANLLTSVAADLPQMLAVRLACGIAAAGVTPSVYALVGDAAPPNRRSTWIAVAVTGLLSALPLGATAGAWAASKIGWAAAFVALGCVALMLAVVNWRVWAPSQATDQQHAREADASWIVPLTRALLPTVAWSAALYGMYTYLGAGLFALGYTAQQIAQTIFFYGIAAFIGALIGGWIADRLGPWPAVRISLAWACGAFAVLGFAARYDLWLGPAVAITSIAAQTFFPAQQASLIDAFHARRATALSWNNSALFLGIMLGSLTGGQAMKIGGFAAIPTLSAGLALAGLLAAHASRRPSASHARTGMPVAVLTLTASGPP